MPQAAAILAGALAVASLAAVALHPSRRAPRIFGWLFVLAVCALVAACLAGCSSDFVKPPPAQFRGGGLYAVQTVPTAQIASVCAGASRVGEDAFKGSIVGCFKNGWVILPNPNEWHDPYARVFAHEAGHSGGWAANHPN